MKKYVFILSILFTLNAMAQQGSYTDPAKAYQRILIEKSGEGSYQQIGNFKVLGTSYLFGPQLKGDAYTSIEKGMNVLLSYNTYNQQLEIYQNGSDKPLIKNVGDVDSFRFFATMKTDFKSDLLFISSTLLDPAAKKFFVQQVAAGKRFNLYKAYKSMMGYVSTNYVQSELRQFDLTYDYYYTDVTKPGLKKLKASSNNLKKEFNPITDISLLANSDDFSSNPEYVLKQIFTEINLK